MSIFDCLVKPEGRQEQEINNMFIKYKRRYIPQLCHWKGSIFGEKQTKNTQKPHPTPPKKIQQKNPQKPKKQTKQKATQHSNQL